MHKPPLLAACALLCAASLSSCKEEPLPQATFPKFHQLSSASLTRAASCEELETQARNAAFLRIQANYSVYLENALAQLHSADSKFCQSQYGYAELPTTSAPETASPGSDTASQVSSTNNQIAEVDEADIVKADNAYIYVAKGNQLRIFSSWPPSKAAELSSTPIKGQAKRLLKTDSRLLIISFVSEHYSHGMEAAVAEPYYPDTHVLDPFPPYFSHTLLTLFDIRNPARPEKLREITLHARFETARSIGNNAILVLSQPDKIQTKSHWYPDICDGKKLTSERKLRAGYIRALNEAYAELSTLPIGQLGLRVDDSQFGSAHTCNNVFINPIPDGAAQTSVVRMDLSEGAPLESASLLSRTGEVFVSKGSVYLAVPHQHAPNSPWFENWEHLHQVSVIHKFVLPEDNPSPAYAASGIVKGNVLNSFSMDEFNGFLRLATTTFPSWWTNAAAPQENILSVLKQEGSTLQLHGQLGNIALNEQIRSARFLGNRAYIVTFRQVDPLFALDLSEPSNPRVLGELKIPGFSTYIHPLNDERLLTVGYDADENTGATQGIQVQLFNVSNPSSLKPIAKHSLSRYSASEAAQTHLGFAYNEELKLLALPATEWNFNHYGYANSISFEGVRLFYVDPDKGFESRGSIRHPTVPSEVLYGTPVFRNIFMRGEAGDFLYSLSNEALFSTQLFTNAEPKPVETLYLNNL